MIFGGLLLVIIAMACSESCTAQSQTVIKMDVVSLFKKGVQISYEKVLNESRSIQISAAFSSQSDFLNKTQAFGVSPEYRFYMSNWEEAPNGFFVAPTIAYAYVRQSSSLFSLYSTSVSVHVIGLGLNVGYQKLINDKISLEAALGPVYYTAFATASSDYSALGINPQSYTIGGFSGFALQLSLNFGLGF